MNKDLHRSEGPAILKMILLVTDRTNGETEETGETVAISAQTIARGDVKEARIRRFASIERRRPIMAGVANAIGIVAIIVAPARKKCRRSGGCKAPPAGSAVTHAAAAWP